MHTEQWNGSFELKDIGLTKKDDSDVGVFAGFASTFGNKDMVGDVIAPGAFAKSLRKKGTSGIKMLWQHDTEKPIGVWEEMSETDRGLEVKGKLILGVDKGREAYELLKHGAIDSMSVGFMVVDKNKDIDYDEETRTRTIKSLDLWEVSLVTFPANQKAKINRVKAYCELGETPDIRDLEALLRDGGLSQRDAKALLSEGYGALLRRDVEDKEMQSAIAEHISRLDTLLTNP